MKSNVSFTIIGAVKIIGNLFYYYNYTLYSNSKNKQKIVKNLQIKIFI